MDKSLGSSENKNTKESEDGVKKESKSQTSHLSDREVTCSEKKTEATSLPMPLPVDHPKNSVEGHGASSLASPSGLSDHITPREGKDDVKEESKDKTSCLPDLEINGSEKETERTPLPKEAPVTSPNTFEYPSSPVSSEAKTEVSVSYSACAQDNPRVMVPASKAGSDIVSMHVRTVFPSSKRDRVPVNEEAVVVARSTEVPPSCRLKFDSISQPSATESELNSEVAEYAKEKVLGFMQDVLEEGDAAKAKETLKLLREVLTEVANQGFFPSDCCSNIDDANKYPDDCTGDRCIDVKVEQALTDSSMYTSFLRWCGITDDPRNVTMLLGSVGCFCLVLGSFFNSVLSSKPLCPSPSAENMTSWVADNVSLKANHKTILGIVFSVVVSLGAMMLNRRREIQKRRRRIFMTLRFLSFLATLCFGVAAFAGAFGPLPQQMTVIFTSKMVILLKVIGQYFCQFFDIDCESYATNATLGMDLATPFARNTSGSQQATAYKAQKQERMDGQFSLFLWLWMVLAFGAIAYFKSRTASLVALRKFLEEEK